VYISAIEGHKLLKTRTVNRRTINSEPIAQITHVRFRTVGQALFVQQPEPKLRAVTNFGEPL
jgi:hypothetical protein